MSVRQVSASVGMAMEVEFRDGQIGRNEHRVDFHAGCFLRGHLD
jgi:hypothetical protein